MDVCICVHACCVVARQYSAVLRMLQMRQSSSTVNFAASEPSFSFSKLLMVRPPLLLLDLKREKDRQTEIEETQQREKIQREGEKDRMSGYHK